MMIQLRRNKNSINRNNFSLLVQCIIILLIICMQTCIEIAVHRNILFDRSGYSFG